MNLRPIQELLGQAVWACTTSTTLIIKSYYPIYMEAIQMS